MRYFDRNTGAEILVRTVNVGGSVTDTAGRLWSTNQFRTSPDSVAQLDPEDRGRVYNVPLPAEVGEIEGRVCTFDMSDEELRFKCLKVAARIEHGYREGVISLAQGMFEFVRGDET